MATHKILKRLDRAIGWVVDRLVDRLYGPIAPFLEVPTGSTPPEPVGTAPVDPASPGRSPGTGSGGIHPADIETPAELITQAKAAFVDRSPGRGHRADNCTFTDEALHQCTNSYGDLCRPGQACWPSARRESLLSFIDRHPSFEGIQS